MVELSDFIFFFKPFHISKLSKMNLYYFCNEHKNLKRQISPKVRNL